MVHWGGKLKLVSHPSYLNQQEKEDAVYKTKYTSPYGDRYGSPAMARVWGDKHKVRMWHEVWGDVLRAQAEAGLVPEDKASYIVTRLRHLPVDERWMDRLVVIEGDTQHDLVAELEHVVEEIGNGADLYLHWGLTSSDVVDEADLRRIQTSLSLLELSLEGAVQGWAKWVEENAEVICLGRTHWQPASPTTMGYRFATHLSNLTDDLLALREHRVRRRSKGFRGATGTGKAMMVAAQSAGVEDARSALRTVDGAAVHPVFPASGQTYPRRQDLELAGVLATLASTAYKIGQDARVLAALGEVYERKGPRQVASSAMPHKTNPVISERVCGIARHVAALWREAWDVAAMTGLERTLDDSSARRSLLPEMFLAVDELVALLSELSDRLVVDIDTCSANLLDQWNAGASESVLAALQGRMPRQEAHTLVREAVHEGELFAMATRHGVIINDFSAGAAPDMAMGVVSWARRIVGWEED